MLEEYSEGDVIFNFGDRGEKFYVILSGSVSIKVPTKKKVMINKNIASKIENILNSSSESEDNSSDDMEDEDQVKKREGHVTINVKNVFSSLLALNYMSDNKINSKKAILNTEEKNLLAVFKNKVRQEQKVLMNFIKKSDRDIVEVELDDFNEVGVLHSGGSFGELALISDRPRSATIEARERSSFLVLFKTDFTKILGGIAEKRLAIIIKFMQELIYFRSWSKVSLVRLAYFFSLKRYKRGQYLYHEGDSVDGIYFIKEGEVTITKRKHLSATDSSAVFQSSPLEIAARYLKGKNKKSTVEIKIIIKAIHESLGGAELFEESATRKYSCICSSSTCDVYFMSKSNFLTRVQNLDAIKEVMIREHHRVGERYMEICRFEEESEHSNSYRLYTPNGKKTEKKEIAQSMLVKSASNNMKGMLLSKGSIPLLHKKNTTPPGRYLRKLTNQEVYQAVNGRSPLVRKYGTKANFNEPSIMIYNQYPKISRKLTANAFH